MILCGIPSAASAADEAAFADSGWTPRYTLEMGVEGYAQVYRLTDFASESLLAGESSLRDTTDSFSDMHVAAEVGLRHRGEIWSTSLSGRASAGTDLSRGRLGLSLRGRGRHQRLDLDLDVDLRRFGADTDFDLSSDNAEGQFRVHWRRAVGERWWWGARLRAEALRYQRQSTYERDQERLEAALTGQWHSGLDHWLELEFGGGRRAVPDSTAIGYDRSYARAEWTSAVAAGWQILLRGGLERRSYDDRTVRSAFWNSTLAPELRHRLGGEWELRWQTEFEWLDYDRSDDTYFDLFIGRTGVELVRRHGLVELGLQPRWSWLRSPRSVEDEYGQSSLQLRVDWFGDERWWFSLTEEVGRRDYREPLDDSLELYSDYWFARTSLLGAVTLRPGLTLEAFLSDEPESHRQDVDDARLTLFTLSLRWRH